jgi:hypothetical protein
MQHRQIKRVCNYRDPLEPGAPAPRPPRLPIRAILTKLNSPGPDALFQNEVLYEADLRSEQFVGCMNSFKKLLAHESGR